MMFDPIFDYFRGRAITIPPLDGAFRANGALDSADLCATLPAPDNLALWRGQVLASSGAEIMTISGASPAVVERFASPVTALAVSPGGALAVALETGALSIAGVAIALPDGITCITALAFGADGALWLANGSAQHRPADWSVDLMQKNASGSVWRQGAPSEPFCQMAGGLAYPYGLLPQANGVIVSESWRHQLLAITGPGKPAAVLRELPGYPCRLQPAPGGGAWLALFAPRNRLIEFVLQEQQYRLDMMASVPRALWIAPALSSGRSFLEPLQCGGIRSMGVHKAWAPSRSYGLVVRLNGDLKPLHSLHSRADGHRHGVCSVLEDQGQLFIAAKGADCVLVADAAPPGAL